MSHTGNPRHPDNPPSNPKSEPTGPVAKDSLANESINAGGGFADNKNPEVLGVKGGSSTLANTDTTNAVKLDAANSKSTREADDATKYPDAGATDSYGGTTSDGGYRGGHTTSASSSDAPNYAADSSTAADLKPKGENLVEGGSIPANRDTYVGDVDSKRDPGRVAIQQFSKDNADASEGVVRDYGSVEKKGEGSYDALKSSEDA